ncbi:hypothetical protein SAMN05216350_11387 [Polaromonas sp. YR568]|nr:hypothetical protein SAMN05216350_11387 [Polaromonas sp. YR568]
MILSWFDAAEAKKFGASLAQFFLERIPKASEKGDKEFSKKVDHVLEKMIVQIVQFKQQHKLNTYKKAQLGNVFKWALLDANVPADYADEITKWLMQKMG